MTEKAETEITRYTIVAGSDKEIVCAVVESNLKTGWELHGDLSLSVQDGNRHFAQAMVKRTVKDTRGAWS